MGLDFTLVKLIEILVYFLLFKEIVFDHPSFNLERENSICEK